MGAFGAKEELMISFHQLILITENKPKDLVLNGSQKNTKIMFHKLNKKEARYDPRYNIAAFEKYQKEHWNLFFQILNIFFYFGMKVRQQDSWDATK